MSDDGNTDTTGKAGKTGKVDADAKADRSAGVDPKLLEMLVCPVTHAQLRYDAAAQELISEAAGLAYPIRDGIPIMLPEEAREIKAE